MSQHLITAIGASAGGIQALKEFFEHTRHDAGIAYVVLLHLSPSHDSQLAQVLQQATGMPVTQITDKTRIEPNHVYVIPPDKHLTMEDGHVIPSANLLMEERRAPVDIFFRSLAETHRERAVGVILSGTGANGSMGMKRIKENGGAVFVQNPREAEFNEMPRNSIATDLVDDVLNVADIPGRILVYRDTLADTHIEIEPEHRVEAEQQALREIFMQLRTRTGHDFSNYKRATLMRRIERRMAIRGFNALPDYAAFSDEHPGETQALLKDLLISVTNFFRDKTPFAALEAEILPAVFEGKRVEDIVRIWVAGCATGEEAYTIAMLCAERTLGYMEAPKVQIFATDIDEAAIAAGREGFYTLNDAADVSAGRLARFFTKEGEGYRVRREIRETILFAHHNFLKDPPFSRIDLVSCRNVLIYLNRAAQERVMETFHFCMKQGGFMLLGTSESVDVASDLFKPHNREQHIYQSRTVAGPRSIIVPETVPQLRVAPPVAQPVAANTRAASRMNFGDLHIELVEQYAPPSLVVNAEFDIVHMSPRAGAYLKLTAGELTQAVLKLIRDELRAEVRNALYQAAQKGTPVSSAVLRVRTDEGAEDIRIHVRPLMGESEDKRGFMLVVFEPSLSDSLHPKMIAHTTDESAVRQLEEELTRMRAQLRASNEQHEFQAEELKAGNEELQAMNEELRSATEELETSKEELQSINEELSTVNQELKVKVEEATMVSNNLTNLINSTDIGTIFLDRSLRVVLFTPAVRSVFNLIPADYGRPLSDITGKLRDDMLLEDAATVLDRLHTIERETPATDGRTFLIRLAPYRTGEDRIQGVVISLVDITVRKQAEEAIRASEIWQTFLVELSDALRPLSDPAGIQAAAADLLGRHLRVNHAHYGEVRGDSVYISHSYADGLPPMTGSFHADEFGRRLTEGYRAGSLQVCFNTATDPLFSAAERKVLEGAHIGAYVAVPLVKEGVWVATLSVQNLEPREWTPLEISLVQEVAERTWAAVERARAEEAPAASEEKYRTLFDSIDEGYALEELVYDDAGNVADTIFREVNAAYERQSGFRDVVDKTMSELMPGLEQHWMDVFTQVAKTGEPVRRIDYSPEADRWFDTYITMVAGSDKYVAVVFNDITARKRHEANLAFLADTSADFAPLASAGEIMQRVGSRLGAHLKLSRCDFSVVDEDADRIEVIHDWRADEALPGLTGVQRISDNLTEEGLKHYSAGRISAYADVKDNPMSSVPTEALQEMGIFSVVNVPHLRGGRWKFLLTVARARVGEWRGDELELIRELASRIYIRIERARTEEALRKSENRLQRMVNVPQVGVLTFSREGRMIGVNDAFLEMVGYSREDFSTGSFTWEDFTPPEHMAASQSEFERLLKTGMAGPYEKEYFRKDGSRTWLMFVAADLGDGTIVEYAIDVNARRQVEKALSESETRYHTLFHSIDEGFCTIELIFDDAGKPVDYLFVDANTAFEKQSGIADPVGKRISVLVPGLEQYWFDIYGEVAQSGQSVRFENRADALGGVYDVYAFPVGDAGGKMVGVLFNNISGRKAAEAALRESEERLRITTESAIDYTIISMDTERRIHGWSRGSERIFGWTEGEATGRTADIIFTPEDRAAGAPETEMVIARDEGMSPDERWHLRKDGSRFYMSGVLRPIYNNGVVSGYVKVARDMTAHKEAEETLRLSEERYRAALQSAEMGAWDWNVAADSVVWNDQHYLVLGLKPDGSAKDAAYFISFVHPEDVARVSAELEKAVAESGLYRAEFRIIRADNGETRWMMGYGNVTSRDESGRAVRMVGVMYDITGRKRVEEQKEEFIGIASHELKTPITSIKAYSEVLHDMFTESGDAQSAKLMSKMEGQIDRLTALVRALLDVTRIREGRLELEKESVELDALFRELAEELQRTTPIRLRMEDILPVNIQADRKAITQVIVNLLSNAIKYARGTEFIDLSIRTEEGGAVVCVRDYGIGMTSEESGQVFERFYRAQSAAAGTYPGLGLGLYISAEIVRLHGGRVWVESEPGIGSTFCFSLPV